MLKQSLEALQYLASAKKALTVSKFEEKFPNVLGTILESHVHVVDSEVTLNKAGQAVLDMLTK